MTSTNGILAAAAGYTLPLEILWKYSKVGADIILALSVLKDRYPVNQKSISKNMSRLSGR
ncbi:hypothetical protein JHX44_17295 [Escherichia coli]|uniref:hypothetical protein n=1 Tax=Escherichia coli TaxID=562 RepID=UPI00191C70FB|nr:hypothetical protein [Escherichia coli]HBC1518869.1 hypothetical protein [Escherichia coli]HBJ6789152.1 hypothetical protein [Salmonella enterica subsp. enterica serovar Istanbul]